MPNEVQLIPPTLSSACYPASPQQLINEAFAGARATIGDFSNVLRSITVPVVEDQDKLWLKIDLLGEPVGLFVFSLGLWIRPFIGPDTGSLVWDDRALDQIPLKDGGEVGVPTLTTGPFWLVAAEYAGRSPMGVGLIPNHMPAKTLALNEDYGVGTRLGLLNELVPHTHDLNIKRLSQQNSSSAVSGIMFQAPEDGSGGIVPDTPELEVLPNTPQPVQQETPNVHPVRGGYMLRRTLRIYHRG